MNIDEKFNKILANRIWQHTKASEKEEYTT
jgi:hypothetical protein